MMRKFFLASQVIFLCNISFGQKSIDGLINAEKSFAAYSVAHGTKEAFLKFADSAGIVFDPLVEAPMNAIETWKKKEKRPGKLDWQPHYAEIATSQDFGYTTGPYTFSLHDSVIARGEYITVWQVSENGEWKFLLDLGINNSPKILVNNVQKMDKEKVSGNASTDELIKAEQNFAAAFKQDRAAAYKKFLSKKSLLSRNGKTTETKRKMQMKIIKDDPADTQFRVIASGIASSGDLGYIYGTIAVGVKQFGYQHIWRKEKDGWKIALEVLRY